MAMMPIIGVLISRLDTRWMISFGFASLSFALFYMSRQLNLGLDFKHTVLLRVYQSFGMAFLFVPINTLALSDIPKEKNNSASGIMNLARNMGGDVGIAFVTTMLVRRSQVHQAALTQHTTLFDAPFRETVRGITLSLQRTGKNAADAPAQAYRVIYRTVVSQAQALAYTDLLLYLGCATAVMVPLAFLMKRSKPGKAAMAH